MIKINKNTSREDIDNSWILSEDYLNEIYISNNSSFQEFTETYATSYLSQFDKDRYKVNVIIPQTTNLKNFLSGEDIELDNLLMSIFGLQLLHNSSNVFIEENKHSDVRQQLTMKIWRTLLSTGGLIGSAKKSYYISNHVKPVPDALGGERKPLKYAKYQLFYSKLSSTLDELTSGSVGIEKNNKQKLIGATFHAAENGSDHARYHNGIKVKGFWGITISRIRIENEKILSERSDLPEVLSHYLKSNFSEFNTGSGTGLNCFVITISDIGGGIQNSLARKYKLNSEDLVNKAFEDLVTSKNELDIDPQERTGFGLGDLVSLLRELGALFHIYTGGQELYSDFSDMQEKTSEEEKRKIKLNHIGEVESKSGTSISIAWINQADKLQDSLI